jgi:hypothetical protein
LRASGEALGSLELAWRVYPWRFSLHSSKGAHAYGGGAHLEEEGHIYYPSFAHEERRTCQIRMRSDTLGEDSLGACFCGERLSFFGSVYLL